MPVVMNLDIGMLCLFLRDSRESNIGVVGGDETPVVSCCAPDGPFGGGVFGTKRVLYV